jgi:ComF family protein
MLEPIHSPLCTHCGRQFEAPQGVDHLCGKCRQDPFDFAMARSAGIYSHAFKALICLYKYQYRSELAVPLSRLLWQTFNLHWDPGEFDCIVPVPLHHRRLRERGFNQSELLIRQWPELARAQGIVLDRGKLKNRMLMRCRHTTPQTGLDRDQRIANLQHAFKLRAPGDARGCRVLLVDDVLTTGATANACARTLNSAKAASVKVLTLARAM